MGGDTSVAPSDEERARVIEALRAAGSRIGLDETERRMDLALAAPTRGELALLVWDLPESRGPVPERRVAAWRSAGYRAHATAYVLVNSMLVGIWGLTDAHDLFWPFFPIAGWGVGLGMHAFGARESQRRRARYRQRRPKVDAVKGSHRAQLQPGPTKATVMFVDIVDSTRLNAVIGDEGWATVRKRCRELLDDCYRAHGGREVNTAGDGFLSRFDSPSGAAACAVGVQRRLLEQRRQTGFAPTVRIGINCGDAIEEADGDVIGSAVNLASRVTATAHPGEILVTEAVADRLDDGFRVEDQGLREMKGLDRRIHVLHVDWSE